MRDTIVKTTRYAAYVAICLGLLSLQCPCVDESITEPIKHTELSPEQIKADLTGKDFKAKLQARKQLAKLPLPDRKKLLFDLLETGDSPTRIIAVKELGKIMDDEVELKLQTVSKDDPDESVKSAAQETLGTTTEPPSPADPPADPPADDAPAPATEAAPTE